MPSLPGHSQVPFSKPPESLSGATILLVDDDSALLEALAGALALRLPQLRIETCSSAGAAFQRVATHRFNVVLSDLRMPGVEGLALLRVLRDIAPTTPFILMTADSTSEAAVAAGTQGAFRVLTKPLDREVVTAAVTEALQSERPSSNEPRRKPPGSAA